MHHKQLPIGVQTLLELAQQEVYDFSAGVEVLT